MNESGHKGKKWTMEMEKSGNLTTSAQALSFELDFGLSTQRKITYLDTQVVIMSYETQNITIFE